MSSEPGDEPSGWGLELLVDQFDDAVAIVDPSGRVLLTNRREELPAPPPSISMRDLGDTFEIFHPDGRPYETEEWPVFRTIGNGEPVVDEEFFRLAPDGSRRYFVLNSVPVYAEDGNMSAALVVARDVTEQKRSHEQLAYLLPMLDHTEDAIVANDAQWHITAWNKGAERIYGWTAEEALGRPATFLGLDESDEQRLERRRQLSQDGYSRGEITVRRKDGSRVPIEAIGVAIRDEHLEITGYLGIHRDITERKRAEDQLLSASRGAETILERISDAFVAVDRNWRYTDINEPALASARLAHRKPLTRGDLLGKNCWEAFPELVGTPFDKELHVAFREQKAVRFEAYSPRTDSWLEVQAYPSKDGLSIYSRDVTERKRANEELAYHASLLDNVEDGVVATDAEDFRITAWNPGAERLYGFTAEEVLGRPAREVATFPGDQARQRSRQSCSRPGEPESNSNARRKDGTPVEVELIAVAVKDQQGEITGYLGIHRDLTERQQTRRRSRATARQQALLADLTLRTLADGDVQALMDDAVALVARTLEVEMCTVGELLPGGRGSPGEPRSDGAMRRSLTRNPARRTLGRSWLRPDRGAGDLRGRTDDERFHISGVFAAQTPSAPWRSPFRASGSLRRPYSGLSAASLVRL